MTISFHTLHSVALVIRTYVLQCPMLGTFRIIMLFHITLKIITSPWTTMAVLLFKPISWLELNTKKVCEHTKAERYICELILLPWDWGGFLSFTCSIYFSSDFSWQYPLYKSIVVKYTVSFKMSKFSAVYLWIWLHLKVYTTKSVTGFID